MTERISILDGDGHVIEWDQEIREYLEDPYRSNPGMTAFPFFPTLDGYHRGAIMARLGIHRDYKINAQTWLNFLDEVGIESTVLYPTAGLAFGLIQDPEWAVVLARAYNNWFYDRYYRVSPRLRGVALVPLQDVKEAVREMRRAVEELKMVGVLLPANGGDLGVRRPLGHPDFWPIYEEAERLNCAVVIHGAPSQGLGINAFTRFAATQALEHPFALMIQLTSMIFEGVFERFPKLRVAYLEAGVGWVPYMMDRLDRSYEVWAAARYKEYSELVTRRPSEYITSGNIFFSCEGGEEGLRYAIERVGEGAFLFASDFPHETNAERAKHEISELLEREDISERAKRNILRENVQRLYQC
jgi:predicted TIM-barrel fold metal-dependent hydrolase